MDPEFEELSEEEDFEEEDLSTVFWWAKDYFLDTESESEIVLQVPVQVTMATAWKTTARTVAEVSNLSANVKGQDRAGLTATEREKLHKEAVSALPTKFGMLSMSDDKAQLQNTYNVTMRIHEFHGKLWKFDMQEQFLNVVKPDPSDPAQKLNEMLNVIENYTQLATADVRASNRYYKEYRPDYMLQNLPWSQELLENGGRSGALFFCTLHGLSSYHERSVHLTLNLF